MKLPALLVLATLVSTSEAGRPMYSYKLKATHIEAGAYGRPSCGNTQRFRKDTWNVRVWDYGRVTVNGMRWDVTDHAWGDGPPLGNVSLQYRAQPDAYTWLGLDLYTNRDGAIGKLTLTGRLPSPSRAECIDVVSLETR